MYVENICISSNLYFNGLGKHYKKDLFSDQTLSLLHELYPKSNGIVGNLPYSWVRNMPNQSRNSLIVKLYTELGELSRFLADLKSQKSSEQFHQGKHDIGNYLTYLLRKYKAIKPDQKINITYISGGAFGYGFKLENKSTNEQFFLKIFNDNAFETDWLGQGPKKEINNNIYVRNHLKHKSEKKLFPKFYFADTINGYYIAEFLPDKNSVDTRNLKKEQIKELNQIINNVLRKQNLLPTDVLSSNYRVYRIPDGKLLPVYYDLGGLIKKSVYEKLLQKNPKIAEFLN